MGAPAALIELASSEFTGFEFASEKRRLVIGASLQVTGSYQPSWFSGVYAGATLSAPANTSSVFKGATYYSTELATHDSSGVYWDAHPVSISSIYSTGESHTNWDVGRVLEAGFSTAGIAVAEFLVFEGHTFNISTGAATKLIAYHESNSSFAHAGSSAVTLVAQGLIDSDMSSTAKAVVAIQGRVVYASTINTVSTSLASLSTQTMSTTAFTASSLGNLSPVAQAVITPLFTYKGDSAFSAASDYLNYAALRSSGYASVLLPISAVNLVEVKANGEAKTLINAGSPVYQTLPPAYDVVIRPYENRQVRWR